MGGGCPDHLAPPLHGDFGSEKAMLSLARSSCPAGLSPFPGLWTSFWEQRLLDGCKSTRLTGGGRGGAEGHEEGRRDDYRLLTLSRKFLRTPISFFN